MSENRPLQVVHPGSDQNVYYDREELSLTDFWLFLFRNWKTIFPIFLVCLATGITAAILWPTGYSVSTTVKVGLKDIAKVGEVTIEPMNTVRTKLEKAFIPLAIKEQKTRFGHDGMVRAKVNNLGGNLVQIQLSGNDLSGERLLSLMQVVIGKLINEHERLMEPLRRELIAEKKIAFIQLRQLENAVKSASKMDDVRDKLKNDPMVIELMIEKQREVVEKFDSKLSGLNMTEVLVPPETSVEKAAGKRVIIVLLSVVLGVILGGGISLISESIKKAKIQIQENKG